MPCFQFVDYVNKEKSKPAKFSAICNQLKRDQLWDWVYLQPENPVVHESRRMCPPAAMCLFIPFKPCHLQPACECYL